MKKPVAVLMALLIAVLCASCSQESSVVPSSSPSTSSALPSQTPDADPSLEPDDSDSERQVPDFQEATMQADIDGDGTEDAIELGWHFANDGTEGWQVYILSVNGKEYPTCLEPATGLALARYMAGDLDGDQKDELVILLSIPGGYSPCFITVLKWQGDGFSFLPVPGNKPGDPDIVNGGFGLDAAITLLPEYKVDIHCEETGYSGTIDAGSEAFGDPGVGPYTESGEIAESAEIHNGGNGPIEWAWIVSGEKADTLAIAQPVWAMTQAGRVAYLVSTLSWGESGYAVDSQRLEPSNFAVYSN